MTETGWPGLPRAKRLTWAAFGWLLIVGATASLDAHAQAAPSERLQVLFLGDDRLHQPSQRAKDILPVLAHNGIDMFYTADPADLNSEELSKYHALVFYHNHPIITDDQLAALLRFVRNGGGLTVVHSASAAFQNSEEYIRLVGGAFLSHGTGTFSVTRVAPAHAAVRGVPTFESWDETYIHTKHNPVDRVVLEVRREGTHEEPWTWSRTYGAGRVFYTAWGHDGRTWGTEGFQRLLAQGTRWASGDWAFAMLPEEPNPPTRRLEVPLPTYVAGAPWNTLGPPVWEAQVAITPEESIELTTLPHGFSMELFAMEPMIGRIVDFTWDERGRMWAVETNDYPNIILPDSVPGGDRILILEDTNGDGRADKSTVFADGLNLATSLVLIDGGLVVAQAPHFFFMRDTTGDDRADTKELIMTGWPRNDTHGTPSNFRYHFDNRILGSVGYNGFRGTVGGRTYAPGEFYAGYYAFTPDGQNLEYLARTSNNTWGVGQSEDGFVFGSTANNRPSTFLHIPARYYHTLGLREPILPGIEDRADIYPLREILQVDQFGRYTSAAAHELYTARAFPREYWNRKAFVTDPTGNLVGMFDLRRNGSHFHAKNEWSFLASRDAWVAPVQVKVGPDGALWVSDFYTLVAQHNPYVEMPGGVCCPRGEGNAYETPNRDAAHARIYRVSHVDAPAYQPIRLDDATPAELLLALRSDNMFWRMTAQRLLVERRQRDVLPALIELVKDHTIDDLRLNPGALHGIWTLHGLGALNDDADARQAVIDALTHPAAGVRRAALQALPKDRQLEAAIFAAGLLPERSAPGNLNASIAQDAHESVRLEAVLALADLAQSARGATALHDLVTVPSNLRDRWLPDAIGIAAARQSPELAVEILNRQQAPTDSAYLAGARTVVQFVTRYLAAQGNTAAIVALVQAVPDADPAIAEGVFGGIAGNPPGQQPWRAEWRTDAGGWAEDNPPALSPEQIVILADAARRSPAGFAEAYERIATLWGVPDLFRR